MWPLLFQNIQFRWKNMIKTHVAIMNKTRKTEECSLYGKRRETVHVLVRTHKPISSVCINSLGCIAYSFQQLYSTVFILRGHHIFPKLQ
jgi:hypothetical protein